MSGQSHPLGFCTCSSHARRPWNRSEHWTADEVRYLEAHFGSAADAVLSKHLHRSVVGLRLKAKRLGLLKRDAGMSSRDVARQFGVDETTVSRVSEPSVKAFIRDYGQYVDVVKMPPDSQFRALAVANAYVSLVDVERRTGHASPYILRLVRAGTVRAARRGAWWYIRAADLVVIPQRSPDDVAESRFRRESVLEARRNRRKGVRRRAA